MRRGEGLTGRDLAEQQERGTKTSPPVCGSGAHRWEPFVFRGAENGELVLLQPCPEEADGNGTTDEVLPMKGGGAQGRVWQTDIDRGGVSPLVSTIQMGHWESV